MLGRETSHGTTKERPKISRITISTIKETRAKWLTILWKQPDIETGRGKIPIMEFIKEPVKTHYSNL